MLRGELQGMLVERVGLAQTPLYEAHATLATNRYQRRVNIADRFAEAAGFCQGLARVKHIAVPQVSGPQIQHDQGAQAQVRLWQVAKSLIGQVDGARQLVAVDGDVRAKG